MTQPSLPQFTPRQRVSDTANPFVLEESSYVRDIYPVHHYLDQQAYHLSVQTGGDYKSCRHWLLEQFKAKRFEGVRNPTISFLKRGDNGDRAPETLGLTKYLEEVIAEGEVLAPTLTSYIPVSKTPSVLGGYIENNIKKRSKAKKAMFAAKMAGNTVEEFFQDLAQRNTKLSNNAISGAHASAFTPLYNQTNHSTLTSNCRITSGSGNANNEKLLSGNRHYWAPYIVTSNIISVVQNTDYDLLSAVMEKYQLHYPSVQESVDVIQYSSDLYWKGATEHLKIRQLLMTLTALQRAAFVYTGDLYSVRKFNDSFTRGFIAALSTRQRASSEAPHKELRGLPEDYVNLAHHLCWDDWAGEGKNYEEMHGKGQQDKLNLLLGTAAASVQAARTYADFIRVVMVSDNVPASVPYFPQSVRRAALTSDTDSTIFTVMGWVKWFYNGELKFGQDGARVAATMIFIAAQAIVHVLARTSINAGIDRRHMWLIAMKNEFYFTIFSPTEVAKHYWALQAVREGNVFTVPEMEIKGVHLKSSNAPKEIIDKAQDMMKRICYMALQGEQISLADLLKEVADVEREVHASFLRADPRYCRRGQIKSEKSYATGPTESNYMHYLFWKEVFAPKYGFHEEPPYSVIRLSGSHKNASDTQEWLTALTKTHPDTAARIKDWMKKYGKVKMGSFMIPKQITDASGVPAELMGAINVRKLTADITSIFYLVLKNLGYYGLDNKMHMMISDRY